MISTAANAVKIPIPSFLGMDRSLFRCPVFQDHNIAHPVSHDSDLIVILQRDVDDLLDLVPRTHDSNRDHALREQRALFRVNPLTLCGLQDRQPTRDHSHLFIPHFVEARVDGSSIRAHCRYQDFPKLLTRRGSALRHGYSLHTVSRTFKETRPPRLNSSCGFTACLRVPATRNLTDLCAGRTPLLWLTFLARRSVTSSVPNSARRTRCPATRASVISLSVEFRTFSARFTESPYV